MLSLLLLSYKLGSSDLADPFHSIEEVTRLTPCAPQPSPATIWSSTEYTFLFSCCSTRYFSIERRYFVFNHAFEHNSELVVVVTLECAADLLALHPELHLMTALHEYHASRDKMPQSSPGRTISSAPRMTPQMRLEYLKIGVGQNLHKERGRTEERTRACCTVQAAPRSQ